MLQIPAQYKPALWGAVVGATALAMVGYSWDIWLTPQAAQRMAKQQADVAVGQALAPFCVEKFRKQANAAANLAELKKMDTWQQASFVEKGGWVVTGTTSKQAEASSNGYDSSVAKACAEMLLKM